MFGYWRTTRCRVASHPRLAVDPSSDKPRWLHGPQAKLIGGESGTLPGQSFSMEFQDAAELISTR